MTEPLFQKLPECDRCWFNPSSLHLCCSVHPTGVQSDHCPDFQASVIKADASNSALGSYNGESLRS